MTDPIDRRAWTLQPTAALSEETMESDTAGDDECTDSGRKRQRAGEWACSRAHEHHDPAWIQHAAMSQPAMHAYCIRIDTFTIVPPRSWFLSPALSQRPERVLLVSVQYCSIYNQT